MQLQKVFISYHHAGDQEVKDRFVREFGSAFVDHSVRFGDIPDGLPTDHVTQLIREKYLSDSTVTIVLIGQNTWRRKHVDWEIHASLRSTTLNPRNGLLGVVLPQYRGPSMVAAHFETTPARASFSSSNIPPRLWDNVCMTRASSLNTMPAANAYALICPWPLDPPELRSWIEVALDRSKKDPAPISTRDLFGENWNRPREGWL